MPASCRLCNASLSLPFCDLGECPLSNDYLSAQELAHGAERCYPLQAWVCETCLLVQLEAFEPPERIFSTYPYFSSYSKSWVEHAARYARMMIERLSLDETSLVMEVASNDGYLLQHFHDAGVRVLGIEPAANVAEAARRKGIRTEVCFFGEASARRIAGEYGRADLIAGNNVIAHVPNLHDFIEGVHIALASEGTATFEFPHLLHLIQGVQFDTIYHEHFSYFSITPMMRALSEHGLHIAEVEELPTHGGSLRIHVKHGEALTAHESLVQVLEKERRSGLRDLEVYRAFQGRVNECKEALLAFLSSCEMNGRSVAGYGAPAKGNTLLNYCGIDASHIPFTVDLSPYKQGRFMPGSHIPILDPAAIFERKPNFVLILPWNIADEIREQMKGIAAWGGQFVCAIPTTTIIS